MTLSWIVESAIVASVVLAIVSFRAIPAAIRHALLLVALLKFAIPPIYLIEVDFIPSVGDVIRVEASDTATSLLQAAHIAGAIIGLALIVARLRRLSALAGRAQVTQSDDFDAAAREIGLSRAPRLLVTDEAIPPIAFGIFTPTVLISRALLARLDARQLRVVFAHELLHHRRGDLIVAHVQAWLTAWWWFNPLFHLVVRQIDETREESCDDFLLARRISTDDEYCALLLEAARGVSTPAFATAVAPMSHHPLHRRIRRIMTLDATRRRRLSRVAKAMLIVIALAVLPGYEVPSRERKLRKQIRDYVEWEITKAKNLHR